MLELFSERTERKQVHAASIPKIGSDETSSKKNDPLLLFPREIGSITSQKIKIKIVDAWDGCSRAA